MIWTTIISVPPIERWGRIIHTLLAPYLINIKKLSYEDAVSIIMDWLDKCDKIKQLDFSANNRITANLNAATKGGYFPTGFSHLKVQNRELADFISCQNGKEMTVSVTRLLK